VDTTVARAAPYLIRRARIEDVPALIAIEKAAFDPATYGGLLLNAQSFRRHIRGRNFVLVATQNTPEAPVAGYALGFVKAGSPYVRFVSLAVLPEHGGRGAGWRLFEGIERAAKDNGYRGVRLEIREDNDRLLARYHRAGYREFARVPDYYSDGAAAIRMIKDFEPAETPRDRSPAA
jgi:ribosomal protein S18 acetylase RimI-like enzyme